VSLVEQARHRVEADDATGAIELLEQSRSYPLNLGEGKLHGAQENHILYWLGVAYDKLGRRAIAEKRWREASAGIETPSPAIYYNDQNPETIFYQGLALQELHRTPAARKRFETLVKFGKEHLDDKVVIDYFAVSLPEFLVFDDDLERRNQINCRYLVGLGLWGLGRRREALEELRTVLRLDPSHQAAALHLTWFRERRAPVPRHRARRRKRAATLSR
jgi:tetratricopeptide (TPR) repeat protein